MHQYQSAGTATGEHPQSPFDGTREVGPTPSSEPTCGTTPLPPPDSSPPRRWGHSFMAPLLAALLGAAVGTGITFMALDNDSSPVLGQVVVESSGGSLEAVVAVAKAVVPSMVSIKVDTIIETSISSGIVYREDGYILTNSHVVQDAQQIFVRLSTGEELTARVVGTAAPEVDIAVIKVDKKGLPAATLGSTHELEVGDLAVALGSPFGLQSTVTAGVISALHRNFTVDPDVHFSDAIQTDAPISPGHSGGALANSAGQVVGIITAIVTAHGHGGVGFAIPIEIAKRVGDQIIETGQAQLPAPRDLGTEPP